jgi:hypothetical protein
MEQEELSLREMFRKGYFKMPSDRVRPVDRFTQSGRTSKVPNRYTVHSFEKRLRNKSDRNINNSDLKY